MTSPKTVQEAVVHRKHIVYLDTTTLINQINYSSLATLEHPAFEFWITPYTKDIFDNPPSSIADLINPRTLYRELEAGRLRYNPVDLTGAGLTPGVYGAYADVLAHAVRSARDDQQAVVVVTQDGNLQQAAESLGVAVTDLHGLGRLVEAAREADANAAAAAISLAARERRELIFRVLAGLLLAAGGVGAWLSLALIVRTVTVWGTLALVGAVGLGLYAVRGRFRLIYGVAEAAIGFMMTTNVFVPSFDYSSLGRNELLALVGGVYVIVRGLDNIGKALERTQYNPAWRRFSGERAKG